jgi:hypothetical protein
MNDEMMFDYLLGMGALRPDEEEMRRKQAMVDALRKQSMEPMQGQMVGKHYVAPGIANAIAQMGTAYMAGQQQKDVSAGMAGLNEKQRMMLEEMRRRRRGLTGSGSLDLGDRDPMAGY